MLHCYGSHFNYIDRYPLEYARFTPDGPAKATHHYRDKQINAYDNTIYYTSSLLARIIDRLDKYRGNTAMIYTSAHGITSPVVDHEASVVSAGYKEPAPLYLNDHNEAVPLMECGVLENDIENLHRLNIY